LKYIGDIDGNDLLICEAIVKTILKKCDSDILPEFDNIFESLKYNIAVSRITLMTRPVEQQILARLSEKEKEIWLMCLLISELYMPPHDSNDIISKEDITKWLADAARIASIEILLKVLLGSHF